MSSGTLTETVSGDVDRDALAELLGDGATVADAIDLWAALENPWEMVEDYRNECAANQGERP